MMSLMETGSLAEVMAISFHVSEKAKEQTYINSL
jgi:hypothetical protein